MKAATYALIALLLRGALAEAVENADMDDMAAIQSHAKSSQTKAVCKTYYTRQSCPVNLCKWNGYSCQAAFGEVTPDTNDHGHCVNTYVPYFSYTGDLSVTEDFGTHRRPTQFVEAGSQYGQDTANVISGALQGTDPVCTADFVSTTTVSNACGYHIHTGTDCTSDAGGHFWNKEEIGDADPWKSVRYITGQDFNANVVTGLDQHAIDGHAFIIHDSTGARIACGIIDTHCDYSPSPPSPPFPSQAPTPAPPVGDQCVNDYVPYFSYTGDLDVTTDFGTHRRPTQLTEAGSSYGQDTANVISGALQGLDPACTASFVASTTVANACGYHIHVGTDCTSDAGGHYWNKDIAGDTDPWAPVRYVTGRDLNSNVVTGLTSGDIHGHAMIIHDSTGARIACGIIEMGPCNYR